MKDQKIFTKTSLIKDLKKISKLGWIKNRRHGNAGGIGNTLEDLLGIALIPQSIRTLS